MIEQLILPFVLGFPLVICLGVYLAGRAPNIREAVTLGGASILFAAVCLMVWMGHGSAQSLSWELGQTAPGLTIAFNLEPLGGLFALVASGLWIVNSLYSIGYMRGNRERNQTRFYMCFCIAIFAAMGVALAANLFTLFIFYEIMTISTYPLVAHNGNDNARRGGRIYLLTLMGTSIGLFLLGIVLTSVVTGGVLDFVPGGILAGAGVSPVIGSVLLVLFAFGVGKAALMPFHFWLPNAMVAPTPVSALLHAVAVVKAGVFTILKISVYIFGADYLSSLAGREIVLGVAVFTLIVASLIALTKDNLKARLAYSTIGQLAYVTVGAMLATSMGFMGGGLQILAHATGKITLFMCAGAIYVATGLTNISDMRGLGRRMPIVFIAFLIGAASIIGLPPFVGAWPKLSLFMAATETGQNWVVWALIVSSLLNVAYLLPIPILALMPPKSTAEPAPFKRPEGTPWLSVLAPTITATLCVLLFLSIDVVADYIAPAFEAPQAPVESVLGAVNLNSETLNGN